MIILKLTPTKQIGMAENDTPYPRDPRVNSNYIQCILGDDELHPLSKKNIVVDAPHLER
jgi:hypothetical protein